MRVALKAYTMLPEEICGLASKTCVSENPVEADFDDLGKSLASAIKSGHLSVLEHASFTFYIEGISRACSHQLVRHRMASYSQQSQRYVKMDEVDMVIPKSIEDAIECELMNGGGWDPTGCLQEMLKDWKDCMDVAIRRMRELHVPEEDIRYIYPSACKTNIVVTMNARSLLNFFELRLCNRAQWEIRELATLMLEEVRKVAPALFETAGPACAKGPCPEGKRSCGHPWRDAE